MTPSAGLLAPRELINNEPRASLHDAWIAQIAELLNIAYPIIEQSAARPPPRARSPPRDHQRPSQAGPRNQGAAAAPQAMHVGSSCQEVVRSPEDARVSIERRRLRQNEAIAGVAGAGRNVHVPGERTNNAGCLYLTRNMRNVT